jgi:hypothetical protein
LVITAGGRHFPQPVISANLVTAKPFTSVG